MPSDQDANRQRDDLAAREADLIRREEQVRRAEYIAGLQAGGSAAGDRHIPPPNGVSGGQQPPQPPTETSSIVVQWGNLLSLRFWIGTFLGAAIIAALLAWMWEPLAYSIWLFWPLFVVTGLMFGTALECPACKKNVKVGATRCHHCGLDIAHTV